MKVIKKLKFLFIMLVIFGVASFINSIYGYNIKFKGYVADGKSYAAIRSLGQTFGSPPNGYKNSNGKYVWFYSNQGKITAEYNPPVSGAYQTSAIMFHSDLMSNYYDENSGAVKRSNDYSGKPGTYFEYEAKQQYIAMGYDYTNNWLETNSLDVDSPISATSGFIHNQLSYVSPKSNSQKSNIIQFRVPRDGNQFLAYRNAYIDIRSGQTYTITDWKLSPTALNTLINENKKSNNELIKKLNGVDNTAVFSLITNTSDAQWNTSYEALQYMYKNQWGPGNFGIYNYSLGEFDNANKNNLNGVIGTSIVNHYDNYVQLPKLDEEREIYIKHVECDEKGNVTNENLLTELANSEEVRVSNGIEKIIANTPSKVEGKNYQEYYRISMSDTLKAFRSLLIADNQNIYIYKGYKIAGGKDLTEAETNFVRSSDVGDSDFIEDVNYKDKKVTIIEFKYYKKGNNIPPPEGGVKTISSKDNVKDCQMTYTPTNAEITPYLLASKFKINNLKYSFIEDGNNVLYTISNFNVDKLESGNISDNTEKEPEKGRIFGGENDIWTLLKWKNENQSSEIFNVNVADVNKTIRDFYNKYRSQMPTEEYLNNLVQGKVNRTTRDEFDKSRYDEVTTFTVPQNRANGLRVPKITANYKEYNVTENDIIKLNDNLNTYGNDDLRSYVLVYNPLEVTSPKIKSEGVIDHSTDNESKQNVIQKNANFTLEINQTNSTVYGTTDNEYAKYISRYFLIFDFDIVKTENTNCNLYNVTGNSLDAINSIGVGDIIPKGTLIEIFVDHSKSTIEFKAKAGGNDSDSDIITHDENSVTLIGVSDNMPGDLLLSYVLRNQAMNAIEPASIEQTTINTYISNGNNSEYNLYGDTTNTKSVMVDYCNYKIDELPEMFNVHNKSYYNNHNMFNDAFYFVRAVSTTKNAGRIYDFKVTDCSDIDYKSVFRKSDTGTVNDLTKIQYFSGIKELKIFSKNVNTLENRDNINIGNNSTSKIILPLGPYKNTNSSYINAPKLGYRISFDLKTSGYFKYDENKSSNRKIRITPSYYYISKDGSKYIENVTLYYKDSDGKYRNFNGSNYTIYFKPNDGYRNTLNESVTSDTKSMSTHLEKIVIGSSSGFELDHKMMSTSGNSFIQTWYGEFKLPNSTIAVGGNGSSLSNPLNDGYIGVKFDIKCIDTDSSNKEQTISYNSNNKNADPNVNTTQWDYEGYVGFNDPGHESGDISIQLEKGTWVVNDNNNSKRTSSATYNNIKGTVVLFDTDNRAANDFD